jgi:hypothetical protein
MATAVSSIADVKREAGNLKRGNAIECRATARISRQQLNAQLPAKCHIQYNSSGDIPSGASFHLRKD